MIYNLATSVKSKVYFELSTYKITFRVIIGNIKGMLQVRLCNNAKFTFSSSTYNSTIYNAGRLLQ